MTQYLFRIEVPKKIPPFHSEALYPAEDLYPSEIGLPRIMRKRLRMEYGVITHCKVVIPPGHYGLTTLTINLGDVQIFPRTRGEYFTGDDMVFEWDEWFELDIYPYELIAIATNEDETYSHAFQISFTHQTFERAKILENIRNSIRKMVKIWKEII